MNLNVKKIAEIALNLDPFIDGSKEWRRFILMFILVNALILYYLFLYIN